METGTNARKRSSATSKTLERDNEEATQLLGDEDISISRTLEGAEYEQPTGYSDRSKWIRPLSIGFAILLLATIAFTSCTTLFLKPSLRAAILSAFQQAEHEMANEDTMLGIELHPENHVFRAPKTIILHWKITSGYRFPDGVKKLIYLANGEFPGPTIECRSGDRLIVHMTDELSEEGVSIHWHGLNMRNSNHMDGAVGLTQCSIAVGYTFTYDFVVDEEQAGTFWWHGHSQVQRGDGMYGGFVVHRPIQKDTDMKIYDYQKEVMLLIGDWYHRSAREVLD